MKYDTATQVIGLVSVLLASVGSAAYSPTLGVRGMYFSGASYCSVPHLQSWNCGEPCSSQIGVSNVSPISNSAKGTFGFVAWSSKTNEIVISFRGSANIQNWITNVDFGKMPYPGVGGANVHSGFFTAY